jgi:hypothetical protein
MKLRYCCLVVFLVLSIKLIAQNKDTPNENVIAVHTLESSTHAKYEDFINNTVSVNTIQKNVEKFLHNKIKDLFIC